jgi:transposase
MTSMLDSGVLSAQDAARLSVTEIVDLSRAHAQLREELVALKHQLEWFKRQIFGEKSERRLVDVTSGQMDLGAALDVAQTGEAPQPKTQCVDAHTRRVAAKKTDAEEDSVPFFDQSRLPVEVIEVPVPEAARLAPDQFEVIGHKESFKLAQRPGSYVILNYRRAVIKVKSTQVIQCAPAPVGVIDQSRADVSFIAGLLLDKFGYHLPLYRQHQRLADAGITVSRGWLTQIAQKGAALLEPIYDAQLESIRASRVKAMDETPIKAGRDQPGKMKRGYFWPIYGQLDEICFPFFDTRSGDPLKDLLGLTPAKGAVLVSDGYEPYAIYAQKTGITHAQCWAHARRKLFEAQGFSPQVAAQGLDMIGALYAAEDIIREKKLAGQSKRDYRLMHAKPVVEQYFMWIREQIESLGLLPSNPLMNALNYSRERRWGLEVYLTDPEVPIDNNHLERALRVIPMGRKAWLFCWTELGARHVGIMQSLIVTCRLHDVDPYDYLVDVLQRVGQHPASRVQELTPRL